LCYEEGCQKNKKKHSEAFSYKDACPKKVVKGMYFLYTRREYFKEKHKGKRGGGGLNIMETLSALCSFTGISGYEDAISSKIAEEFKNHCDEVTTDPFYNVLAIKRGRGKNRKKVMLMAHMDEIGFLVKKIEENGFLRITPMGGVDPKILSASEVMIHGKKSILGIIGAKPPHLQKPGEANQASTMEELLVDTGYSKESLESWIRVGDPVSFRAHPLELLNRRLSTKSLDNRAGVAVLLKAAEILSEIKHENDVIFVTTVQEEVGLRGAIMAAFNTNPDVGIVVDVGFGDFPEGPKTEVFQMGKGPAIGIGPNLHKKSTKKMMELAKENNIPYQVDPEPGNTGTEAWGVQVTKEGIPTMLLSIPLRYMHTAIETICVDDVKNSAVLMAKWAALSTKEMEESLCF
jgi:tetrahedral aminopeptidase